VRYIIYSFRIFLFVFKSPVDFRIIVYLYGIISIFNTQNFYIIKSYLFPIQFITIHWCVRVVRFPVRSCSRSKIGYAYLDTHGI
jgi:hypothetical protein